MFRGLATVSYFADDVAAAETWYRDLLGIDAYFRRPEVGPPAYVEFRVGDHEAELGIVDRRFAPGHPGAPGGVIAYWHTDDVHGAYDRLLAAGATPYESPVERGPGFVTASVVDPFGNVLGIMYNAHYLAMQPESSSTSSRS